MRSSPLYNSLTFDTASASSQRGGNIRARTRIARPGAAQRFACKLRHIRVQRVIALTQSGKLHCELGEMAKGITALEQAVNCSADRSSRCLPKRVSGTQSACTARVHSESRAQILELLPICEHLSLAYESFVALNVLASIETEASGGEIEKGKAYLGQMEEAARAAGQTHWIADARLRLGLVAWKRCARPPPRSQTLHGMRGRLRDDSSVHWATELRSQCLCCPS